MKLAINVIYAFSFKKNYSEIYTVKWVNIVCFIQMTLLVCMQASNVSLGSFVIDSFGLEKKKKMLHLT